MKIILKNTDLVFCQKPITYYKGDVIPSTNTNNKGIVHQVSEPNNIILTGSEDASWSGNSGVYYYTLDDVSNVIGKKLKITLKGTTITQGKNLICFLTEAFSYPSERIKRFSGVPFTELFTKNDGSEETHYITVPNNDSIVSIVVCGKDVVVKADENI